MAMEFGIFVPQGWRMDLTAIADPVEQYETMTRVARQADAGMWDSIWVYDHLHTVPEPTLNTTFESWTISATLARDTERVKVGQLVNCNGFREPSLFAKIASTVDVAANGRLLAGLGGGWYEHEWLAYGYGFPETRERMARFREATEIIHKMWTEDYPTFHGTYYTIDQPINEPKSHKPGYKIPLWIGGSGPNVTLKLVAQFGDACNVVPETAAESLEHLKRHCDTIKRNYDEIVKSSFQYVYPIADGADPVKATAAVRRTYGDISYEDFTYFGKPMAISEIIANIEKLQIDGIQYVIIDIPGLAYDNGLMQMYEEEVISVLNQGMVAAN